MTFEDVYKTFDRQIWITKGSRFNAYRRLERKQNASIFSISILSLYVLIFAVLPVGLLPESINNLKDTISVIASVFILVLSLLEARKSYEVKSERLHNNAIALNELYSRWKLSKETEKKEIIKEYHDLIKHCPENHAPYDTEKFKTEYPQDFSLCKCECLCTRVKYFVLTYWLYIFLVLIPIAIPTCLLFLGHIE